MQRAGATTPSTSPISQVRTPAPLARNNIVTYLATQYDGLDVRGLSDVDSLVLACVSYYQLPDVATAARRPNLTSAGGRKEIEQLMAQREPLYRECATITVATDNQTVDEVVDRVYAAIERAIREGSRP